MLKKLGILLGGVILSVGVVASGEAQVACGDVIAPGQTVVLQGDLGPCTQLDGRPALLVDAATLDLNGFTLSCGDPRVNGIALSGRGAKVRNGIVTGCLNGVLLRGQGYHVVSGVIAQDGVKNGFRVLSDRNRIEDSGADGNAVFGFLLNGDLNKVEGSFAANSGRSGFRVKGANNTIVHSASSGNALAGIHVSGRQNRITDTEVAANTNNGILMNGRSNRASLNTVEDNGFNGIRMGGTGHLVRKNTIRTNGRDGVRVLGASQVLGNNRVIDNGERGIGVQLGAQEVKVRRNVALDNGLADLHDDNPGCPTNVWLDNEGTANQPCAQ